MSKSLPEQPNLAQLRKQAKELRGTRNVTLSEAQLQLARDYGFSSWSRLKRHVLQRELFQSIVDGDASALERTLDAAPYLVDLANESGETPLHVAAAYNDPAMVDLLMDRGASANPKFGESAHSALSWALTVNALPAASKLVQRGVVPDLFCSAGLGLTPLLERFWVDGRWVEKPSQTGSSRFDEQGKRLPCPPTETIDQVSDALYIACRNGQFDTAKFLLDRGADPNFRAFAFATPLAWAEFSGNDKLCAMLRSFGGSDDLLDREFGASPRAFGTMVLAGWGFYDRLKERLKVRPDAVHERAEIGTPLHAAVKGNQLRTASLLLEASADREAKNKRGQTPSDLARELGYEALAQMIERFGEVADPQGESG